MAETPQYQDTQPIIQPQKVSSAADSYEAFAKTLGSIAKQAGAKTEELATDQSNTMYLASVANIDDLKLSAESNILTDPANASKYAESLRDSLEKVNRAAFVNKSDRQKLQTYGRHSVNAVELDAVKTTVKQAQIGAAFEHYENWPAQLNVLKDIARTGDQEKIDAYQKRLLGNLESLVNSGALTPLQGGNAIKSMSDVIDMEKDVHDMINNVNAHTPQNFHSVMSNPLEPNKTKNLDYPVDENTNWLVNYHASDRSFQAAEEDLQNHRFNVRAYEDSNVHQREQLKQQMNGIRKADGLIDANSSLPQVQSRIQDLEGKVDYGSIAEQKALKQYVTDLKNGNSEKLMARTSIGGRIVRDYIDNQAYLNDRLRKTNPDDKEEIGKINSQIIDNKNQYVNNAIAFAQGHHWPNVHPIPKEDVAIVENGFNVTGDPAANAQTALSTFNQYTRQNQMYFADQMKNPKQRVVMQAISLGNDKGNSQRDNLDFLSANQNRQYTSSDPTTGNPITNDYLRNKINTSLTDALKVIRGQHDPTTGAVLNNNLIQAGMNYAHFLAQKNLQFSKKDGSTFNAEQYVDNVKQFISNSYKPMTGANYIINSRQNDIDRVQMDNVAQYAINEGEAYLRRGMSEAEFIALKNRGSLTVTITPTNKVEAVDANGNVAFSSPLTSDLTTRADMEIKKIKKDKITGSQEIFKKNRSRSLFLSPEEQLLNLNQGEGNAD